MAKYLISYDYHRERDYNRLYKLLGDWKAKRILASLWLANLNGTAAAVRDVLKKQADTDDAFVVIELKTDSDWAHTAGVEASGAKWLENNI